MINSKQNKNKSQEFTTAEPCQLLEFLLANISGCSRNNIKSMLKYKQILVDGTPTTQYNYQLKTGNIVTVDKAKSSREKKEDTLKIIYEDDDIIAIDKPSGLLTVATDKEHEVTAYRLVTDYVRKKKQRNRVFVLHRLDRDTSGVLLFTKTEDLKLALQNNWSKLVSTRGYIAIVEGKLKEKNGRIKSWLKQTKTLIMYSSDKPSDGLEAITNYKVVKEGTNYSLIEVNLETGRKNQIRVHMKDLGHSIAGDSKYGAKTNPVKRLALHANKLELTHPFSQKFMSFKCETPTNFMALFNRR